MNHDQQENRGASGKLNRERDRHDRDARDAKTQSRDSHSDPDKFDADLPYEQQPTWQRQGEEGRYRDTFNVARDERTDEPVQRTAHKRGRRDHEPNPARPSDDDAGGTTGNRIETPRRP